MQKVTKDEAASLLNSMTSEWKSVLLAPSDVGRQEYWSAEKEYWTPESHKKVRRVQSEPQSPGPASG